LLNTESLNLEQILVKKEQFEFMAGDANPVVIQYKARSPLPPKFHMSLPQSVNLLTACQVRGARAMMMKSVRQFAKESGVSDSSIRRVESTYGVPDNVTADLLLKLQAHLERKGFKFTWDDDGSPGVCWGAYPGNRPPHTQRNRRVGDSKA
jgi:hypothetical protein